MHPQKYVWYVSGLAVGGHTYSIEYYRLSASTGMYVAWPSTTNNWMIVEELEMFGG
eukprot:m.546617 g.546617  ORF g.546617 m.546617 type:complete len:56 (-) comp57690_c0_seq9:935-1102(-)